MASKMEILLKKMPDFGIDTYSLWRSMAALSIDSTWPGSAFFGSRADDAMYKVFGGEKMEVVLSDPRMVRMLSYVLEDVMDRFPGFAREAFVFEGGTADHFELLLAHKVRRGLEFEFSDGRDDWSEAAELLDATCKEILADGMMREVEHVDSVAWLSFGGSEREN